MRKHYRSYVDGGLQFCITQRYCRRRYLEEDTLTGIEKTVVLFLSGFNKSKCIGCILEWQHFSVALVLDLITVTLLIYVGS